MEEFIYILIGVIWIAASIYKATQKGKKRPGQPKTESPQAQDDTGVSRARSLLEELLEGQQLKAPEPAVSELSYEEQELIEMEEKEQPARSFQSEYAAYGFKGLEALSGEGVHSSDKITFKDELKGVTKKKSGQNKINLRKAIIYSVILERPYI